MNQQLKQKDLYQAIKQQQNQVRISIETPNSIETIS